MSLKSLCGIACSSPQFVLRNQRSYGQASRAAANAGVLSCDMQISPLALVPLLSVVAFASGQEIAPATRPTQKPPKMARPPTLHAVSLGAARKVPFTPADATPEERKEGHDHPDRSSAGCRRAPAGVDHGRNPMRSPTAPLRSAASCASTIRWPASMDMHWVWQPGPWLLVDRVDRPHHGIAPAGLRRGCVKRGLVSRLRGVLRHWGRPRKAVCTPWWRSWGRAGRLC